MNGIKYVTNEKAEIKAVILDIEQFKLDGISAADVLLRLSDLQQIINNAPQKNKKENTSWKEAKKALDVLNK
ncbi:MAG: hypothetical protein EAZ51_03600 [Sphingobacteriales bacterium]|nr:MAG: hypothetical protein EAZ64_07075 [Sphingobacteriales bacterium]TAF81768.1 MAG: hypothetical protein EAZ51_03600 [Sphingobacteriales bacterium]